MGTLLPEHRARFFARPLPRRYRSDRVGRNDTPVKCDAANMDRNFSVSADLSGFSEGDGGG